MNLGLERTINWNMKKRKKILLTGASGTVGFEVLKQLYENTERYDITLFDIKSKKTQRKFAPYKKAINIVYGTIFNENDLNKISSNQEIVIHLAALIPPVADEKPTLAHQVNTVGTEKLIKILETNSPNAFFIYSSSISVYGDRIENPYIKVTDKLNPSEGDAYAKTKIEAENSIKNSKLDWAIFRLAAIMGGHKMSKLMFHQPLNTSLEIATPEDTARAFVNAIEKKAELSKKIFNLGGGANCRITYDNFLAESFKIFGLGELTFPPKSFAEKNFHCGYYEDGDQLNDILRFRKDTLETYFEKEKSKVTTSKRYLISVFKKPIKNYLQRQSEPLIAYRTKDKKLMQHFFNTK